MINKENINTNEETKQTTEQIISKEIQKSDAIYEELLELEMLPDLIQLFIYAYNLDNMKFSESDRDSLGDSHKQLLSLLVTIQRRIWAVNENLHKILEE